MAAPTNTSPATALVVTSLPYSVTLDAWEVPGDSLWFRYDKVVGGYTALGLASPVPLLTGTYVPRVDVYTGTAGDLTSYLGIIAINDPLTVPLQQGAPVISYFFEVRQNGGGAFTESLLFQLEPGPVAAAPEGSFAINDDTDGFPMAIVSTVDGSILQSFPFPSGERAAMLPDGTSMWHDQAGMVAKIYDNQFQLVATVPWILAEPSVTGEAPMGASLTQFYVGHQGSSIEATTAKVTTVSPTGVLGPTVWDLGATGLRSLMPSEDDAVLYYVAVNAIKRWDLVNDVPLSDLTAGEAGLPNRDVLVLADGSVVTAYNTTPPTVKRYSAAGATLNTYTLAHTANRLSHSGDGTSFWVWTFPSTGLSRFTRYRASDGVVLDTIDSPNSTGGVWQGASPGTPTQAHSTSCPFVPTPDPLPKITFDEPEPEPEPTFGRRRVPQRRLRRAPHLSDEQIWMFHHSLQVDLETGLGLVSGQGSDPQVMLRWSDDGGKTWSNEHWCHAGRMGEYRARVTWNQLGRGRDRVYEMVVADAIPWHVVGAILNAEAGGH